MHGFVNRTIWPLLAIVALWLTIALVTTYSTEILFGIDVSERLAPFLNVHLMEEAAEGSYHPLADWLFVVFRFCLAIVAFGVGTYLSSSRSRTDSALVAIIPALLALAFMAVLFRFVWSEGYPAPLRTAFVTDLMFCVAGTAAGYVLGRRKKADA